MSEMLDRVAKEIAAEIMELTASQRATFVFPDHANGDTIERARSAAGLAIAANRELSDAEAHKLLRTFNLFEDRLHIEAAKEWHRRMIDAALNSD